MKKDLITIIFSLLALVLIVFLLIFPTFDSLDISRAGLAFEKNRFAEAETRNQELKALDKKFRDNPNELEKLMKALPKESELAGLMINLENLATASGLIMGSIDFDNIDKKTSTKPSRPGEGGLDQNTSVTGQNQPAVYKIMAVRLALRGGYNNFKSYLAAIEKNSRLMDVTSFNFSRGSQEADLNSFRLELDVYYQ